MKKLPLDGVRVLDLTMMWAGPYASQLLGVMGAEVLKIESPRAWDNIRTLIPQPGVEEPWNSSYYFNEYNHAKKSVILDLAQERGKQVFLALVARSDVVIENYRADVMANLGLGYEVLRAANPAIVMVSMAGFGKTGAERNHVGFGPIIEQMAGLASMTGYGGEDSEPMKSGISYGDPVAGIAAAGAVALGLIHRRKTGQGCMIDLAQRETMACMIGEAFVAQSLRGQGPVHVGNRSPRYAPQGAYRCLVTEQWIAISCRDDAEWQSLSRVIGAIDLADLSFAERVTKHDELDERISAWTAGQDVVRATGVLQAAGVPAMHVVDSENMHDDPNLVARGFWEGMDHPRMHQWRQAGPVWRFQEAQPSLRRRAPLFGEHTREVLRDLLGYGAKEFAELEAAGITAGAPVNPGVG